jgi:hypothetical protein
VVFPVLIIRVAFYIILQIIRKRTYYEEIKHYSKSVAGYLYIDIIPEQPIAIEKDPYHQHAMRLKQRERVPENVGMRRI